MRFLEAAEHRLDRLAETVGALDEPLVADHLDHGQRRGDGQRIAGISAAKASRRRSIHHFCPAGDRGEREPARQTLGGHDDVGIDSVVLQCEKLAGAREAGLDLVGDQQHAVLVAQLPQPAHERRRGHIETAFPLHGFDDDRGDPLRIDVRLEQPVDRRDGCFDADAVQPDGKRRVIDLGRKRAEPGLVRRDFAGERHRHHRAAVKRSRERDDAAAARRGAGDLHRILDGLRAGGEE